MSIMSTLKYTFYQLNNKKPLGLNSKTIQEHLLKWSMKKCIHINYFAFNQEFTSDDIEQFALDFFRDNNVTKTIQINFAEFIGSCVTKVQTTEIPCTVTSMMFFDKLLDSSNNIVCNGADKDGNHIIRQCMEIYKNDMYMANNLKMMLFDDECEEYFLYDQDERNEFMFRLLQHFVTGGQWCQDDIIVEPYLNATKNVYKDVLAVEKTAGSKIQVSSKIYKVIVFNSNNTVIFPKENRKNSFAYLSVNSKTRTVTLVFHNVGETIYT